MLASVEWGQFKLGALFDITGTKYLDSNAVIFENEGVNFVGRTFENNGIQGKISPRDFFPNEANTITATVIGNYKYVHYQKEPYYCSQNINKLVPNQEIKKWNDKIAYYFVANIQKFVSLYNDQQGGYRLHDIRNHFISLPIKNNKIDFNFMENFIGDLEAQRIADLEAYLNVTGLKDYVLTEEEEEVLEKLDTVDWKEYKMDDLFERVRTNKLPYKAKELPDAPKGNYELPCLTSSFKNQGLNYYAPKDGVTILKNVISIPSNSDVYRAYYQSREFTVLSDAYAIRWKYNDSMLTSRQYLFMVTAINKVTDLPIYSHKSKLGGWNVVRNKNISLPIKNGEIDFDFIEIFIVAIQKILIKEVVLWIKDKH